MQLNLFNVLYVTGAAGTVGYLLFLTSRRLPGWLWAHRPRSVGDWLLAPFEALLGVFVTMVVFSLTLIGWPAVLPAVLLVEKRHRAQRRAIEERADEALLQEVRSLRGNAIRVGGDDAAG